MPSDSYEQLLDRAASWYGIDGGFWDIFGTYHTTSVAAKQAILRALGVAADSAADLEQALGALARNEWERLLPSAVVAGENGPVELPLHVAAESLGGRARIVVRREDGESSEFELDLGDLPRVASAEMDGRTWVRVHARLPMQLPLGYHQVTVSVGGSQASTRCIVTPERAYMDPHLGRDGRAAGIAVSLYGVRATPYVEYERVSALKLCFLKLAFAQFLRERRAGSARRLDVDRLAGALPGPRLGGDTGLPPEALAPRVGQPEPSATRPSLAQVCVDMFRP